MISIKDLLKKEANNEPLTDYEKYQLQEYRRLKKVKHSALFIYHSRKLPEG